jgi:hypothetical protein
MPTPATFRTHSSPTLFALLALTLAVLTGCTADLPVASTSATPAVVRPTRRTSRVRTPPVPVQKAPTQPEIPDAPAPAPTAEPTLFDADVVHPLHLRYTAAGWKAQQADLAAKLGPPGRGKDMTDGYQHEDLAWADVEATVAGQVLPHTGMRWNGRGSLLAAWHEGQSKLPFRLNFDALADMHPDTKGRKVQGYGKIVCANGQGDSTYLRHVLAAEILRDRGVPAPQAAFFRVTLDPGDGKVVYAGLCACLEDPSDVLPEREFDAKDGNVYKPEGAGGDWMSFSKEGFPQKNNKKAADWSDVQAAIGALHAPRTDAAKWRKGLNAVFDVGGFLRWLAVNTAMWNPDTYGMRAANYYPAFLTPLPSGTPNSPENRLAPARQTPS